MSSYGQCSTRRAPCPQGEQISVHAASQSAYFKSSSSRPLSSTSESSWQLGWYDTICHQAHLPLWQWPGLTMIVSPVLPSWISIQSPWFMVCVGGVGCVTVEWSGQISSDAIQDMYERGDLLRLKSLMSGVQSADGMRLLLRILVRLYILQTSSPPSPSRVRAMNHKRHPLPFTMTPGCTA